MHATTHDVLIVVTSHALERWRERFNDPLARKSDVVRAVLESRPLNEDERRDLREIHSRKAVRADEAVMFHEPTLAVFFGSQEKLADGRWKWTVATVLKLGDT